MQLSYNRIYVNKDFAVAEKNPAARPARSERMTFMVTPAEKQLITDIARLEGFPVGQYLRDTVLFQSKSATGTIFYQAMPPRKPNGT
jgi:hypothetical protein